MSFSVPSSGSHYLSLRPSQGSPSRSPCHWSYLAPHGHQNEICKLLTRFCTPVPRVILPPCPTSLGQSSNTKPTSSLIHRAASSPGAHNPTFIPRPISTMPTCVCLYLVPLAFLSLPHSSVTTSGKPPLTSQT